MAYPKDSPEQAFFWPFAAFSPEYQAVIWAVAKGVPVRFIDLPVVWRLPKPEPEIVEDEEGFEIEEVVAMPAPDPVSRDPIGVLARAAGYEDGESWWRDVIEENPDPGPIFAAVADAMRRFEHELSVQPRKVHLRPPRPRRTCLPSLNSP